MKQKVKAMKVRKSTANDEEVELGSVNVFADLGIRDAEERLLKAKLATTVLLDAEAYAFFLESLGRRGKPSQSSRAAAARYRRGQRKGVRYRFADFKVFSHGTSLKILVSQLSHN